MKYLVVLGCLLTVAYGLDKEVAAAWKAALIVKLEKCGAEVGASAADIETIKSHQVPASHEGKCAGFCMHKMFKIQKEDGSIDLDGGLSSLEMIKEHDAELYDKMVHILKTCGSEVTAVADPCETAGLWGACMIKEGKAAVIEANIME